MTQPSISRLNLLRSGYLLLVIGLGLTVWLAILDPAKTFSLQRGVVVSMLGSMSILAAFGLRYPLAMLPVLFFEIGWKSIWLLRVALPLWSANRLDTASTELLFECSLVIVFPFVIPWSYVWSKYVAAPADPWCHVALA